MGVRGIARWSNAPPEGVKLILESISKQPMSRSFSAWKAEIRTIRRHAVLSDGTTLGSERLLWQYHVGGDQMLVIVEDAAAPKRADFLAAQAEIAKTNEANASEPIQHLEVPSHFRHTLISFKPPIIDLLLVQLGGAWSLTSTKTPMSGSGRVSGGLAHRIRIEGFVWSIGSDWQVRVGSVFSGADQFRGIIMEIEYLPVANLPDSSFIDAFTMSILPSLPSSASFNSVILPDDEWAHVCGINVHNAVDTGEEIYAGGDEQGAPTDDASKDDWRRSAYMIVQVLKGEGLL